LGTITLAVTFTVVNIRGSYIFAIPFMMVVAIFGFFYFRKTNNSLIKITAAPECLVLKYLISRKQIKISYQDITHIGITHISGPQDSVRYSAEYTNLDIVLLNGDTVTLLKDNYSNYDELKEAIRRHRFNLD